MGEIAFYQDRFVPVDEKVVPIQERGHQFGDGVYEVVRVYKGKPFLLKEHMERLIKSAQAIHLTLPYSREKIEEIILEGLNRSELMDAEIYFQITRGIYSRQHHYPDVPAIFSMVVRPAKKMVAGDKEKGVSVITTADERWLNCYIKSLNLLPNVMAKQKAIVNGCSEAILVRDGVVTEGSSTNVFVVKDHTLYTHPATKQILHGITRAQVIQLAEKLGIPVVEEAFDLEFLKNGDEVFITSTTIEVMPVRQIDEVELPKDNPVTKKLMAAYDNLIK